jgi:hypothetical protein
MDTTIIEAIQSEIKTSSSDVCKKADRMMLALNDYAKAFDKVHQPNMATILRQLRGVAKQIKTESDKRAKSLVAQLDTLKIKEPKE